MSNIMAEQLESWFYLENWSRMLILSGLQLKKIISEYHILRAILNNYLKNVSPISNIYYIKGWNWKK